MTLYLFTADSPGVSTCVDGCLAAWPPLLTGGGPVAQGAADAGLLGTLTRDDGTVQVTYGGWPLYFFASDMAAGDVAGQGVNGAWFVVAPDGSAIEDGRRRRGGRERFGRLPGYGRHVWLQLLSVG
jgi:predicted lipoprotein with Yx(FWY)xxD motif